MKFATSTCHANIHKLHQGFLFEENMIKKEEGKLFKKRRDKTWVESYLQKQFFISATKELDVSLPSKDMLSMVGFRLFCYDVLAMDIERQLL